MDLWFSIPLTTVGVAAFGLMAAPIRMPIGRRANLAFVFGLFLNVGGVPLLLDMFGQGHPSGASPICTGPLGFVAGIGLRLRISRSLMMIRKGLLDSSGRTRGGKVRGVLKKYADLD